MLQCTFGGDILILFNQAVSAVPASYSLPLLDNLLLLQVIDNVKVGEEADEGEGDAEVGKHVPIGVVTVVVEHELSGVHDDHQEVQDLQLSQVLLPPYVLL